MAERAPCREPFRGVGRAGWTPSGSRMTASSAGILGTSAPVVQLGRRVPLLTRLGRKLGARGGVPNEASRGGSKAEQKAPLENRDDCHEPKLRPPLAAKQQCTTSDLECAQHEQRASVGPRPPTGLRPTAGGGRPRRARLRRGAPRGSGRGRWRCPPRRWYFNNRGGLVIAGNSLTPPQGLGIGSSVEKKLRVYTP